MLIFFQKQIILDLVYLIAFRTEQTFYQVFWYSPVSTIDTILLKR